MRKVISAIAAVLVTSLLVQGCYMFVGRDGKYYASTEEAWSSRQGFIFPPLRTTGDVLYYIGWFIPVVGWVTLVPAGFAITAVECCVVAPAFDTICLPYDYINNRLYRIAEEEYQKIRGRLDADLVTALSDGAYLDGLKIDSKLRYLHRWLAYNCRFSALSAMQVDAILAFVEAAWENGIINDPSEVNRIEGDILQSVYRKCDDDVALSRLIDHTIKVKKILGDGVAKVAVSRFFAGGESQVKFSDEQLLRLLDEVPYAQNHVSKVLKYRQKEHNPNEDERH
jgi:hypothetical protein